jgi:hypothetical protein
MIIGTHVQANLQVSLSIAPLSAGEFRRLEGMGETYFAKLGEQKIGMERLLDIVVHEEKYSIYKWVEQAKTG